MRAVTLRSFLPLTLLAAAAAALPQAALADRITEVSTSITNAGMTDIAAASDGSLWITAQNKGSLLSVRPDGQVAERPITGLGRTAGPRELAGDRSGHLWSTDPSGPVLIRSETSGESVEFTTGAAATRPVDLATGQDGNVWFTTAAGDEIGRVTPEGDFTFSPIATHAELIATGTGETAAWFTTQEGQVGRITPEGTASTVATVEGKATGITEGPGATVWVSTAQSISRITPGGAVTTFTDGLPEGAGITRIAAAPGGHVWFSARGSRAIGRITQDGVISLFTTTNAKAPGGIGAPPDALAIGPGSVPVYFGQNADGLVSSVVGKVNTVGTPTGSTGAAEEVDVKAAMLTGLVNAEDGTTSASFEYGITPKLGSSSKVISIEAGLTPQPVRIGLTDLEPKRTYFYRVVATNSVGTFQGPVAQFTTKNVPLPTTPPLPVPPKAGGTGGATLENTADIRTGTSKLALGGAAAKLGKKGIVKVKLACPSGAPCSATVEVTAKLGKGKKAKSVVIAKKDVTVASGKTASVGLRINAAGQKAIRQAGKKGLATLAVFTVDKTKTRARLTLKR